MSKDDHDKFVLFLIVVGFIVLVVCGLAWQGERWIRKFEQLL